MRVTSKTWIDRTRVMNPKLLDNAAAAVAFFLFATVLDVQASKSALKRRGHHDPHMYV